MLKSYKTLLSINLIEERMMDDDEVMIDDLEFAANNRYLWRWTYPSIDNDVRFFIEKRLSQSTILTYDMGKCKLSMIITNNNFAFGKKNRKI